MKARKLKPRKLPGAVIDVIDEAGHRPRSEFVGLGPVPRSALLTKCPVSKCKMPVTPDDLICPRCGEDLEAARDFMWTVMQPNMGRPIEPPKPTLGKAKRIGPRPSRGIGVSVTLSIKSIDGE